MCCICVCIRPQVFWIIKQISIQSMSKTKFIVPTSYGCENTTTLTNNAHAFYRKPIRTTYLYVYNMLMLLNIKGAFTMEHERCMDTRNTDRGQYAVQILHGSSYIQISTRNCQSCFYARGQLP